MFNRKRLGTIAALMTLSLLMLSAFMAKWLSVQYQEEKARLKTNLSNSYEIRARYYFDKAFGEKYLSGTQLIRSAENDSFEMMTEHTELIDGSPLQHIRDSQQNVSLAVIKELKPGGRMRKTKVLIRDSAFFGKDSAGKMTLHDSSFSNIRISFSNDAKGATSLLQPGSDALPGFDTSQIKTALINILSGIGKEHFSLPVDTIALRRDMDSIMKSRYAGISYHLAAPQKGHWLIAAQGGNKPFFFSVSHYTAFLVRKISPQIGFCLILLSLCSLAFLLAYATLKKQIRLTAQKNDFISNMSHELKTPVTTAQLALEAFNHFDLFAAPQKTKEYLQIAAWEIKRLEMLVTNVLNNASLEEGRIAFTREPFQVNQLLQQLVFQFRPACAEAGKEMRYDGPDQPLFVTGDPLHIQGALYNIMDNALKYGRTLIRIRIFTENSGICITVSDDGNGIAPEYRQKIFDKFFRIPVGNEHQVKGYGLGLHYAYYVIRAHGGTITVSSAETGGAVFTISLPQTSTA